MEQYDIVFGGEGAQVAPEIRGTKQGVLKRLLGDYRADDFSRAGKRPCGLVHLVLKRRGWSRRALGCEKVDDVTVISKKFECLVRAKLVSPPRGEGVARCDDEDSQGTPSSNNGRNVGMTGKLIS